HTYTDNARVLGVEPQFENVSVPRQECRSDWVNEARPVGRRDYGGAVVGGLAGALLGNQVGRGHGREAATAAGASRRSCRTSRAPSCRSACPWNLWDDRRMKLFAPLLCALFLASALPAW